VFVITSDDMHTVREPLLVHDCLCQATHLGKIKEDGPQVWITAEDFHGVRSRAPSQVEETRKGREIDPACQGLPEAARASVLCLGKRCGVLCIIGEIAIGMGDVVYRTIVAQSRPHLLPAVIAQSIKHLEIAPDKCGLALDQVFLGKRSVTKHPICRLHEP
jgi:hypothetical protein